MFVLILVLKMMYHVSFIPSHDGCEEESDKGGETPDEGHVTLAHLIFIINYDYNCEHHDPDDPDDPNHECDNDCDSECVFDNDCDNAMTATMIVML